MDKFNPEEFFDECESENSDKIKTSMGLKDDFQDVKFN